MEKNDGNILDAFKRILNPASGIFFLILLGLGIGFGVSANYVVVYLQEDMGASSAMVGKFSNFRIKTRSIINNLL